MTTKNSSLTGAKIVIWLRGESKLSPERIKGFTEQMTKFGVPLVDKPADMIGKVDGMLIEAVDGTVHYERAKPFLEAGIPSLHRQALCLLARRCEEDRGTRCKEKVAAVFVIVAALCRKWWSSPPMRGRGKLVGCTVHSPCSLSPVPERNAGLFHYGIHGVEMLYTLMGSGRKRVTCTTEKAPMS